LCVAAKAAEAASSGHAYYDPVNPHQVYMPGGAPPLYSAQAPPPQQAPPPYSEAAKKND